jgi:uncharacterized protein (TIGR02646 family)
MRQISQGPEPVELTEWRAKNQGSPNFAYGELTSEQKVPIVRQMLAEQGCLCAFTGLRISANSCHIAHLKPQDRCRKDGLGEDVAYWNMVAGFPGEGHPQVPYGGHKQGNWPRDAHDDSLFVSPRSAGCEQRFAFEPRTGKIKESSPSDVAARTTISQLGLDHPDLRQRRAAAVKKAIGPKGRTLTLQDSRRFLERLERESSHRTEFCFVLIQALKRHVRRLKSIKS